MIDQDLLIHIGYQKTGSKWLQRHLFTPSHLGFRLPIERKIIKAIFIDPHPLDFSSNYSVKTIDNILLSQEKKQGYPVLSHEGLSGNPHTGGYESKEIAIRLSSVFSNCKILIVIREQAQMILSTYFQYLKAGGTMSIENYLKPLKSARVIREFEMDRFKYHRLIKLYYGLFGQSNVLVLPYELLASNPLKYVETIQNFCNIQHQQDQVIPSQIASNKAYSNIAMSHISYSNRYISKTSHFNKHSIIRLPPKSIRKYYNFLESMYSHFPKFIEQNSQQKRNNIIKSIIGNFYSQSNTVSSELINRDLFSYGYK